MPPSSRKTSTGLVWLVCALGATTMLPAQTATETVDLQLPKLPARRQPLCAPLTRDSAGNLYGTTNQGGQLNLGVVFRIDATGNETILHSFRGGTDGASPYSGVLLSSSGALYGTTYQGGSSNAGVVFEIGPSGHEKILYTFTGGADGGNPYAGVIADSSGNLYGTTYYGGTGNAGVVYKVTPSFQETVLYSFTGGKDGSNPYAGVIADPSGNLYGTTVLGGAAGYYAAGVVYMLNVATGQETVLHSFNAENSGSGPGAAEPYAGVIRDPAGNLYGVTPGGGKREGGFIYKIDTAGKYTELYNFSIYTTGAPYQPEGGLIRDSAGNLYGTTDYGGTANLGAVYKFDSSGNFETLYSFPGAGAGTYRGAANAGVISDTQGNLYGTTPYGGVEGMVYRLDPAGVETTLYSFTPSPGGTVPFAGVYRVPSGRLYGATQHGGAANWGVVYEADAAGGERALYSFSGGADGAFPESTPVLDRQGNVYGTTATGGLVSGTPAFGVVYKIDTAGQQTVLHTFTGGADGGLPGAVTLDSAGNLYGAAGYGTYGNGVVYKLAPSGQFTVLYSFTGGADGGGPGRVILDPAGNLYGTTYGGGSAGLGVIFKVSPGGKETVLYSFPGGPEGAAGGAGLFRDSAGNLYGTTLEGGGAVLEAGSGVVFEYTAADTYTVLYRFKGGADGGNPLSGVIADSRGNLYGTTRDGGLTNCTGGCGVVYKLDPSGQETVLYSFTGGADGDTPYAPLVLDSSGNLYGTTPWGGKGGVSGVMFSGGGVVFKITPQ
jgi:uncharacterized repeat protein (TIGR03803 family)